MSITDRLAAFLSFSATKKIHLWTSGGYMEGHVTALDGNFLEMQTYIDGSRSAQSVTVVVDSISAWA